MSTKSDAKIISELIVSNFVSIISCAPMGSIMSAEMQYIQHSRVVIRYLDTSLLK